MTRIITGRAARSQLGDLVQGALVAEFLNPGSRFILHARQAGNAPVLDNRLNTFRTLLPDLGYREVRLADVVAELLARGSAFDLGVQDAVSSESLIQLLEAMVRRDRPPGVLRVLQTVDPPSFGLLAGGFYLEGDVAWAAEGIALRAAEVKFHTAPGEIHATRTAWGAYWEKNSDAARIIQ